MNTLNLVPLNPDLRTSYARSTGLTRDRAGQPVPYRTLRTIGESSASKELWKAPMGLATDAALLAKDVEAAGCEGLRFTEVRRLVKTIVQGRAMYQAWIDAGSPAPGGSKFNAATMKTAYLAPPNGTNHQWAGAIDFDVFALQFPGATGDQNLSIFWELAKARGFTPIIAEPRILQSEAWHFDHLGPLGAVRALFIAHKDESPLYRDHAKHVAAVGCILAGTYAGPKEGEFARLVQALLLLAGIWVGVPDGDIGPKTVAGLRTLGIVATRQTPCEEILGALAEQKVGEAQLVAF